MFIFLLYFFSFSSGSDELNETKVNETEFLEIQKNIENSQNFEDNLKKEVNENNEINENTQNEKELTTIEENLKQNIDENNLKIEEISQNNEEISDIIEKDDKNTTLQNERIQLENKFETIDTDIKKAQEANKKFENNNNNNNINNNDNIDNNNNSNNNVNINQNNQNNEENEKIKENDTTNKKPQKYDWYDDEDERGRIPETPPPKRFPIVHVLWPEQVIVSGRMNFTIRVSNCDPGLCYAKVGDTIIQGYLDNEENACFKSPPHKEGVVPVLFSKDGIKWYGDLQLEYVIDKKPKSNILSFVGGLLVACALSVSLFYFITGKRKLTPANEDKLKKPSKIRQKAREAAPKKRVLPTV